MDNKKFLDFNPGGRDPSLYRPHLYYLTYQLGFLFTTLVAANVYKILLKADCEGGEVGKQVLWRLHLRVIRKADIQKIRIID